jgi:outer membrane protein assembly factor BamE (lipoprotein component of BamABCDE complex)
MKKMNYISVLRLCSAGVISASILLGGCRLETDPQNELQEVNSEKGAAGTVTLEMYNQLDKGMSYEEVEAVIGSPGKHMTEEGDTNEVYIWDGENESSFLSVSFKRNKLSTKTQVGLR